MSQTSLLRFAEQQKSLLKNPRGFWLGEVSVEAVQAHEAKDPLSEPEKNIMAIEALINANEELYLYLVADIGIQNHAIMPEFKNTEFNQQYSAQCFQYPKQIEIFLKAGGKLLDGMVEYREMEGSTIIVLQHNESSLSPAEHAHSLNTFSKMDKRLLLEVFNKECFDADGVPLLGKSKKFNQYILPSLFTGFYPQSNPVSAEHLRETQLMHPLPHGWLISFMEQNRSYDIASNLTSKQVFQHMDAHSFIQDTQYARDVFGVFLADIHESVDNPESLSLKEKLSPYEVDDFFDENWKSTWESDLILAAVVQSTLFPELKPLPDVKQFLDTAVWMARYFNMKSNQLSSHICGFLFNHLMLNPSLLEEADFSNNNITQINNASEVFDVLSKSSDIFLQITSSLLDPSSISLQHLSNHSLNNAHIISAYMEWSGSNGNVSSFNHFTAQESLEIINTHVSNFTSAESIDSYWFKQIQQLKQDLQDDRSEELTLEKYKMLRLAGYKSGLTKEILKMQTPLVMEALNLANRFSEDLSIAMVKKHVASNTIKAIAEPKIAPVAPNRF